MTTYGNKMWNNATDNDEKTVVPLKEKDLLKLCSLMDNAGMNYFAFSQNGNSKIAFNTKDLDWFKRIMGKEIADRLPYQKPAKPYAPPEKNIIGNVNYRYIPQKSYFKADPDIALKMAEIMEKQGIEFSGRIYSNGIAKLTVSRSDLGKLEDIQNDIIQMRKPTMEAVITVAQKDLSKVENIHDDIAAKRSSMAVPQKEKPQIIGNMSYKDIVNMELYSPDITSERYNEIKPYLDKLVKYSGLITDGRVVFVGEKGNTVDFINALTAAEKKCDLLKEYEQLGVLEFIDERYDEKALQKIKEPLTTYANATEYERMADKNGVFTNILNAKQEIDDELALAEIYSAHDFTDEQKILIAEGFHNGLSDTILEQIDESFTVHQITTYFDMYDRAVKGEIDPYDVQAYLDRGRFEETLSPTDTKSVNTEDRSNSILSTATNIPDEIRDKAKKALIVNLYGGPGAGKSTTALQLVAELKKRGLHAEYVSEVAKDLVYAKAFDKLDGSLENQKKILTEQKNRLDMIAGNVDVAVTDSPLMLNTVYLKEQNEDHLSDVLSQYNEYNNFNILISRDTSVPFENEGRIHNLEESMEKDGEILSLLESNNIEFERFDRDNIGIIAEEVSQRLIAESALVKEDHIEFSFGKDKDWFTESELLADFAEKNPTVSFALANAVFEYLDEKQHIERDIPDLNAGWYKKTDFVISGIIGGDYNYEGRFDIGDGKGTGGGSIIDHIRDFNQGILDTDSYPYNTPESKTKAQETLNTFIPFLEAHSQLTAQEQEIFDSFVKANPIRDEQYIEARRFAKEQGMPFSEYYSDGADEDLNPYVYDGSMSPEDFRKMQLLNTLSDITKTEDDTPYKLIEAFEETTANDLKKRALYDVLKDGDLTEKVYAVISESDYINDKADNEINENISGKSEVIGSEIEQPQKHSEDTPDTARHFVDRQSNANAPEMDEVAGSDNSVSLMSATSEIQENIQLSLFDGVADNTQTESADQRGGNVNLHNKAADLKVGDIIMFDGARREIEEISTDRIKMKDLDAPDFGGILLGTSDVLAYDGWQQDMESKGFKILSKAEKSEPVVEAPEVKKVHQVITNAGFDGGIDDKMEYTTVNEAVKAGRDYLADGYLGFSVYNQETKKIEHIEGDFPLYEAFNPDILRINGMHEMADEKADIPFWEKPDTEGEHISLFGDPDPIQQTKTKSEFAKGPVVDGIQVYEALAAEIDRGTGFVHGKLRVQDFYEEQHPTIQQLADFLKKEYGTGGHSGEGKISLVEYDSKGMTFFFENDEKYRHSWFNVAVMTEARLKDDTYLSAEQKAEGAVLKAEKAIEADNAEREDNNSLAEVKEKSAPDEGENFAITDDTLGEGGAKTKFRANVEAIKTLKTLENEHRPATNAEKETLSKYVGWGGLQNAFDSSKENWTDEYALLKELLTDKEYISARASTLDAFYTSPVIIDGIYEALGKFGYEGGNVLEPALGVGNFIGRMPEEISKHTKFYGTELDSISGRIAQKIYPNADIKVEGFEKNNYQDGCFDVAVGNVPFGNLGFKDDKHGTNKLHDYFFAETLDKLKNGGIMAFVTSAGTLDKRDESTRRMLADKADFIGAIRLPGGKNGAFKDNAGTDVTTDIIFLQKHEGKSVAEMSDIPDWVHIGETADGLPINKYFEQHPDMVLGTVVEGNKLYGSGTMVVADDGFDLKSALHESVGKLSAEISPERGRDVYAKTSPGEVEPLEDLRSFSLFEKDNNIYFKTGDKACEFKYNQKTATYKRAKAFISLRDITRELLAAQEQDRPESEIKRLQAQLNDKYDDFYKNYGLINSVGNKKIFRADISYNLLTTLEKEHDGKVLIAKSDMFTKRTIKPAKAVEHVDTAMEALTLSVAERAKVDFEYMQKLTDMPKKALIAELKGEIFPVPELSGEYQTKSEYLSGDIRQKLNVATEAAKSDSRYEENVKALEIAMPEPLKAGDIDIKIGAAWIDPKIYEQFMYEVFQTPRENRSDVDTHSFWKKPQKITVEYSDFSNSYIVKNKRADHSVTVTKNFGTDKINAYGIMESLLNLRDPKITKLVPDPNNPDKDKRVVDIEATKLAQRKAEKVKKSFKEWIFKDPERREKLVKLYNEKFNCIRPREYDGSNLRFPQMNAEIELQDHQKNAVAHALFGGNTLFAHSVGAGKTFEMIASAMESKRLGLCTKSLMVVPNHLTEQIGGDFMKLYPAANILVATKNDFTKSNRQKLFSKIATGNYDAVIIGHSQLKMIPVSKERQEDILQSQINDITNGIKQYKEQNEGGSFSVKAMERTKKSLVKRLDNLRAKKQDDVLTFEEMGIDKLILDEAHEFKNLFTPTKLQNVSGISSSASEKALDLFLKCQYLDEKTGGKGIIMATGTPLSNSVTELHTMMRYLEYDFLKSKGLEHFDNWVTVFGEQKTDWELAPAGNKFKQRTRIAHYTGLPELMSMFKQVADVRTADTLNLKVPECETHIVNVEATDFQKQLVQELADRADDVQDRSVDPTEDNMLRITSDGRKLGLDPRLIDPDYEDNPNTKLNQCVNNVFQIYEDTAADKSTQIIFCDLGVPHGDIPKTNEQDSDDKDNKSVAELDSLEEECDFCVYDDIKKKLMNKGIPESEIAYIHSAKTEAQKSELFDKVKKGEVRVLLGSTSKMGTGTNVQDKLIAVHDLDIPWRPADMEQRRGRIVRQGNENEKVHLYRYVTKGTFDAYSYQTLENKQKFISQIMTSKTPVRKCDDVDQQALSYSEIKALCTGDERIKEKMQLDNEVKELRLLKAEYTNTVYDMQDKIRSAPKQEADYEKTLSNLRKDKEHIDKLPIDSETKLPAFKITIGDKTYTDRTQAAKAYEKAAVNAVSGNMDKQVQIGNFQGFPLSVSMDSFSKNIHASLKGAVTYHSDVGASFSNNLKRLENIYKIEDKIAEISSKLNSLRLDVKEAEKIVSQPFAHEDELSAKSQRLEYLTEELNQAAIEAKKNNPDKKRTNYFDCARLKKEAAKSRVTKPPKKDKEKSVGGDILGD